MWSRYAPRDEKLAIYRLKHVFKTFGKYVKRIHFANYITPSKLEVMLKFCKNVIHLSLPSSYEKDCTQNGKRTDSGYSFTTNDASQCFTLSNNLKEVRL